MYKFAVFVLLCAPAFGRPSEDVEIESHIIGGTPAKEGQYPFIVSLRRVPDTNISFCGGALISDRWVLTAAHCVLFTDGVAIGAGSIHLSKQKIYDVDKIIPHPKFNVVQTYNDVALIRLKSPIKLGGYVQTIDYPTKDNLDDKNVTALGWGFTTPSGPISSVLMTLKRPIISNKECSKRLNFTVAESQICLGCIKGSGMYYGDSGSPLLYRGSDGKNFTVGIVSWGVPGVKGYPDVFTRVSSFVDWITGNTV